MEVKEIGTGVNSLYGKKGFSTMYNFINFLIYNSYEDTWKDRYGKR